ncbi:hypothetical protein H9I45_04820 [Polaribacter haliotis]|uniref:Cytochrome C Planctomycete-type domain-containing protein n=1 Tax=Polaribacter haliotis TaxID=1888915 RepID=A0A7L8AIG0_9FLAO|nr:hypothetical protein [Polaribacter haliotis]QOD61773.1 hypothetical protein H9I45_04820 [Polaribacter haliotis]
MKLIYTLFIILLAFSNCSNSSTEDLIEPEKPTDTSITYNKDVKKIIDQSCATSGCHNTSGNSGGLILENFNQVKTAVLNRGLINRMESSSAPMPASGNLPQTTINIIKNWQQQGFIE